MTKLHPAEAYPDPSESPKQPRARAVSVSPSQLRDDTFIAVQRKKRASSLVPGEDDEMLGAPSAVSIPDSQRRWSIASADSRTSRHSLTSVITAVTAVQAAVKRPSFVVEAVSRVSHLGSERSKRNSVDPRVEDVSPSPRTIEPRDSSACTHSSPTGPCVPCFLLRSFATSRQRSSSRCERIGSQSTIGASAQCSVSRGASTPNRVTHATASRALLCWRRRCCSSCSPKPTAACRIGGRSAGSTSHVACCFCSSAQQRQPRNHSNDAQTPASCASHGCVPLFSGGRRVLVSTWHCTSGQVRSNSMTRESGPPMRNRWLGRAP